MITTHVTTGHTTIQRIKAYLAVVNTDYTADHFGNDDHVSEVGLDDCGFLIRGCFLLCFAQLFDKAHWTAFETTVELATSACVNELRTLFRW